MTGMSTSTAAKAIEAGLERIVHGPKSFESKEHERAYRRQTIEIFRQAFGLSPSPQEEVEARLYAAIEFVKLEDPDDLFERIGQGGSDGAPDAYAGVSWFREAAVADKKHGVRLWDQDPQGWFRLCERIDVCIRLFGDHMESDPSAGSSRMWWESFTKALEHLQSTVVPVTYLSLGNLLLREDEPAAARACYERCLHPTNLDSRSAELARKNLDLLNRLASTREEVLSRRGFRGSWKVLSILGGLAVLGLLARQVAAFVVFAAIAGAYWWFQSRSRLPSP